MIMISVWVSFKLILLQFNRVTYIHLRSTQEVICRQFVLPRDLVIPAVQS